jgi:hypothetical protein
MSSGITLLSLYAWKIRNSCIPLKAGRLAATSLTLLSWNYTWGENNKCTMVGGCGSYVVHDLRIMVYSWPEYFILNTKLSDWILSWLHWGNIQTFLYWVGFEVLTAVSMKMAVFWVVAPWSLVEVYQRFRGPCCLHHQGDEVATRLHGATTHKSAIFLFLYCFPCF